MEGTTKAPDYTFRFGGQRKFFVEAKKPSVSIQTDAAAAYQLRRYAWNAKLPVSVLTNFAELAVYDTRMKPREKDKAPVACIAYFTADDYIPKFAEVWGILSKDAVLTGSFDRFAEEENKHKGKKEVDDAFLGDIETWREMLAKNIALRNDTTDVDTLNYAVQATIDRIVFLRIAEDRGVEPFGQLRKLLDKSDVYRHLCLLYKKADTKYNSGLFDFTADRMSLSLKIDDKALQQMIGHLYYPKSPYGFAVIPVEILGNVYERFLGKVIRLTAGHQAKVEEKPAVKKAGGVYYTPAYIVDDIVERTIGPLVDGRGPKELEALTIVDPACGSGSFLLGAYDFLMRHYLDWYARNRPQKKSQEVFRAKTGLQLTTHEKKRILLTHIFGVDIDPQAVEVTKLSLLLKVLEGENEETIDQNLKLLSERALPNLEKNIRCGNSLISPQELANIILTSEEKRRINAFDWKTEFREVFKAGGFGAVIGNPPYVRIQTMKHWAPLEVELYKTLYTAAGIGNYDIYTAFVEKGLSLLRVDGRLGFILPHKFFNSQYGKPLRTLISRGSHLHRVVHFGDLQVFKDATTYTCLLFLTRQPSKTAEFTRVYDLSVWRASHGASETGEVTSRDIGSSDWDFVTGKGAALFARLRKQFRTFQDVADIFVGVQTSADDVYIMEYVGKKHGLMQLRSKSLGQITEIEAEMVRPIVSGTDISAFAPLPSRQYILFPYHVGSDENATLISFTEIMTNWPRAAAYLQKNRGRLEGREHDKFKDREWHRFGRNQNLGIQGRAKACVPRLVESLHSALDSEGKFVLDNVDVGGVTLKTPFSWLGLDYVTALLNSRLLQWIFPSVSAPFRGGFRSANKQFLGKLPIAVPNLDVDSEKRRYEKLCDLAAKLRDVVSSSASTPYQKTAVQREVTELRRQLDEIVYELYGTTRDEIRELQFDAA